MIIKPIETHYKNYRFRSRLEARWAVFFDNIGHIWEYEVEGYTLSDGRKYLPDFVITSIDGVKFYYEVKPRFFYGDGKLEQLIKDMQKDKDLCVYGRVLSGDPYDFIVTNNNYPCPRCLQFSLENNICPISEEYVYCEPCDFNTPCGGDNPNEEHFGIVTNPHKGDTILIHDFDYKNQQKYWNLLKSACLAARSARFEFNERK